MGSGEYMVECSDRRVARRRNRTASEGGQDRKPPEVGRESSSIRSIGKSDVSFYRSIRQLSLAPVWDTLEPITWSVPTIAIW